MSANTRTLCPGWPKGPCGQEAGTPWTNLYCDRCDEKRRAYIEAAVEKNILEPTVVDAPVVVPAKEFGDVDWTMYLGRQSDQEDYGDCDGATAWPFYSLAFVNGRFEYRKNGVLIPRKDGWGL